MFLRFLCAIVALTLSSQNLFAESGFYQDEAFPETELPQLRYEEFERANSPLVRSKSTAPEFRVVAWNVGQTSENPSLRDDLHSNIEGILGAANSPDVLLLVEAGESTFKLLKSINFEPYGYDSFLAIPYSEAMPWAYFILVWKSKTLRLLSKSQKPLSLTFGDLKGTDLSAYESLRDYVKKELGTLGQVSFTKIDFLYDKQRFSLFPVHFSNIWPALESRFYEEAREGAKSVILPDWVEEKNALFVAKTFVLKNLLVSRLNPHAALVESFLTQLNEGFDSKTQSDSQESVLVIGDFNAFPRIDNAYGLGARKTFGTDKSWACAEMEKTLKPIYAPQGSYSFPTASYRKALPGREYKLLIDLGYFRGPLWRAAKAEVMPLSGSDHYPVYYSILHNP